MILFTEEMLKEYGQNDHINELLKSSTLPQDQHLSSHKWLMESMSKRMIFESMYGDLLNNTSDRKKILDVGGGYSSLSRLLLNNHDYSVLDIMAHDDHSIMKKVENDLGVDFWINSDWSDFQAKENYDIVIANDLFPNVDQRLSSFLDKFLPIAGEIRTSLTYYNEPRHYQVKRVDADEIFTIVAWDGYQLAHTLDAYSERIPNFNPATFSTNSPSLFANGRQIAQVSISGN